MGGKERLKRKDDRNEPTTLEKTVMAISGGLTLLLLGYLVWQAVALPEGGIPMVTVERVETTPEGDTLVAVKLVNEGSVGLRTATVTVACGDSPPEITFENIPASGTRVGSVLCPPGTAEPTAQVSSWVHA